MKKTILLASGLAIITGVGVLCLRASPPPAIPDPVMGAPSVLPTVIAINRSTVLTITVPIPDSSLIPNSVNLLRLPATGTQPTNLGVMHDDGQYGDAVAGDQIYSLRVTFTEPISGQIRLQVSAPFRGVLRRVLSAPINIAVTSDGTRPLPPDPGPAGSTTIAGIDSDGDGVRDDVQRYIALNYTNSVKTQAALTQLTKAYLAELLDAENTHLTPTDSHAATYALDCLFYVTPSTASQLLKQLEGQILNTKDRISAYLKAEGGITTNFDLLPTPQQQQARCMINPDILPN